MALKDNWKQTGVGLGHAFRDLGKSVIKSVATGMKKADEWANKEDKQEQSEENKETSEEKEILFTEKKAPEKEILFVEKKEEE